MLQKLRNVLRNKKGQGLVEYAILLGGVALVTLVGVSVLGHKTNDLYAMLCTVIPGAHADDAAPIMSGHFVAVVDAPTGTTISTAQGSLSNNLGLSGDFEAAITEAGSSDAPTSTP